MTAIIHCFVKISMIVQESIGLLLMKKQMPPPISLGVIMVKLLKLYVFKNFTSNLQGSLPEEKYLKESSYRILHTWDWICMKYLTHWYISV